MGRMKLTQRRKELRAEANSPDRRTGCFRQAPLLCVFAPLRDIPFLFLGLVIRTAPVHSLGDGLERVKVEGARGVRRVRAAAALSAAEWVEGARSSAASGMPLTHFQPPLFPSSASAIGVERGGWRWWVVGGGCRLCSAGRQAPVVGAADRADDFQITSSGWEVIQISNWSKRALSVSLKSRKNSRCSGRSVTST